MWKPEHRLAAQRSGLRYPSDLTDAQWAIAEPMIRQLGRVADRGMSTCAKCSTASLCAARPSKQHSFPDRQLPDSFGPTSG